VYLPPVYPEAARGWTEQGKDPGLKDKPETYDFTKKRPFDVQSATK